jgi:hypothetical protein
MGSKPSGTRAYIEPTLAELKTRRAKTKKTGPEQVGSRRVAPQKPTGRFVAPREATGRRVAPFGSEMEDLDKRIEKKEREEKELETRKRLDVLGDVRRGRRTRGGGGGNALRRSILTSAAGVTDKGSTGRRKTILGS